MACSINVLLRIYTQLLLPASPVEYSTHLQQSSSIFPCNLCLAPHQVDEKITLCGMNDAPFFIVGRLVTLSCLGDMLGKPVFAFSLVKSIVHSGRGSQRTYDISASIEVIIGMVYSRFSMCRRLQLTFNRSVGACKTRPQGWSLGLVRMVGGTLYRTNESGDRADWSSQDAESSGTLSSLQRKLRIGAINRTGCQSNMGMGDTIELRTPMLEPIETTNPSWNLQRLQAGLQLRQIATMAFNATASRSSGMSLKSVVLDKTNLGFFGYLVQLCGLKVSICKGVAQRVPLPILVADLMPIAVYHPHSRWSGDNTEPSVNDWEIHFRCGTIEHLQRTGVEETRSFLDSDVRYILQALKPTGLDQENSHFIVTYSTRTLPLRGSKLPTSEAKNLWTSVLADSTDSTTFAFLTEDCLQTSTVRCRKVGVSCDNTIPALEICVIRETDTIFRPRDYCSPCIYDHIHHVKTMEALLQARVDKESDPQGITFFIPACFIPPVPLERLNSYRKWRNDFIREIRIADEKIGREKIVMHNKSNHDWKRGIGRRPEEPADCDVTSVTVPRRK
jgi:hypothetical protein